MTKDEAIKVFSKVRYGNDNDVIPDSLYGFAKDIWNAAVEQCAETAEVSSPRHDDEDYEVKSDSILKNTIQ